MVQRMARVERREQILEAATRAFGRRGYTATGLDDVATEAGITRVLLYRHFDSKNDMYRAALGRALNKLGESIGPGAYDEGTIPALMKAASTDPDGFRLLFRHAAREPEFRDVVDTLARWSMEISYSYLTEIVEEPWREWAARLISAVTLEAVIAWLDAGEPEGGEQRVVAVVQAVVLAAQG